MADLKTFLKEKAEERRARKPETDAVRDEWVAAIEALLTQMKEWLREADEEGILTIEPKTYRLREETLGLYEAPGMTIALGGYEIEVKPIARFVVGPHSNEGGYHVIRADGRVDLTNGYDKYRLYHVKKEGRWKVVDEQRIRVADLTRATFDQAVQSLLE